MGYSEAMSENIVTLFGSTTAAADSPQYRLAYEVGFELARAGYVVCNGGYDGTMEAAHHGAKDAGGRTIGVTCAIFSEYRGFALQANPYVDEEYSFHNLYERVDKMMRLGCAYVVLPGGTGTLVELSTVWEFVAKGLIPPRPIILLGGYWRAVVDTITAVRPAHARHVHRVETAAELVACLAEHAPPE